MNFEKYTDRSKGFIQAAQTIAMREGHPQLTPEHVLKALLDDSEGMAAGLIRNAGGDPKAALAHTDALIAKMPRVSGSASAQSQPTRDLIRLFDSAERLAQDANDQFVTAERLLLAIATDTGMEAGQALAKAGVTRFHVEEGTHWVLQEHQDRVLAGLLPWLRTIPEPRQCETMKRGSTNGG